MPIPLSSRLSWAAITYKARIQRWLAKVRSVQGGFLPAASWSHMGRVTYNFLVLPSSQSQWQASIRGGHDKQSFELSYHNAIITPKVTSMYLQLCLEEELLWTLCAVIDLVLLSMGWENVLLQLVCLDKHWNNRQTMSFSLFWIASKAFLINNFPLTLSNSKR